MFSIMNEMHEEERKKYDDLLLEHNRLLDRFTDLGDHVGELRDSIHHLEEVLKQYANPDNWHEVVQPDDTLAYEFTSEYDDPWELADRAADPGKYV